MSPIRVLIVEDSPIALTILKRMLSSSADILIVGTATNGKKALEIVNEVNPDVICTDLHMPEMNGLELTQEIMVTYPKPILVISASVQEDDNDNVFQLLQAGAVDIFPKPVGGLDINYQKSQQELINKIKILSGVKVFTKHRRNSSALISDVSVKQPPINIITEIPIVNQSLRKIVVIGASTGGPQALDTILTSLPGDFPIPIICIQHISEGFLQGLVDWLNPRCKLHIKIAQNGELPQPGNIYFAPEQKHLELDLYGKFAYSSSPPLGGHRPAVTITFNSVAKIYKTGVIGVLLTGMGRDGAEGMRNIYNSGGLTIAQDELSCVVFGMPKEAIALKAVNHILPLSAIANK
ncbi:MAG TPA: chemotaxis-specific protein-glutamate methyltransferase CheB, partial [Allocoleopsis sp.]